MGEHFEMMEDGLIDEMGEAIWNPSFMKPKRDSRGRRKRMQVSPKTGVTYYLGQVKGMKDKQSMHDMAVKYCKTLEEYHGDNVGWHYIGGLIQQNFDAFKKFVDIELGHKARKLSAIGLKEMGMLDDAGEPYPKNPPSRWYEE